MARGRPGLGLSEAQIRDFQSRFGKWMEKQGYSARDVAELIGFRPEYINLLLGKYQEKLRAPSANVLARLKKIGFDWSPPPARDEDKTTPPSTRDRPARTTRNRKKRKNKADVITRRDVEIVLLLARVGIAVRDQLQRLFFPSVGTAVRRLRHLTDVRLLQRFRPPVGTAGRLYGSAQYIYTLGSRGAQLASEALGRPVRPAFRGNRPPAALFLEHRLQVTEFIVRAIQAAGDRLVEWETGAVLEDRVTWRGRQRRFAPDAYIALRLADGSLRHALVEVDCGTMGRKEWLVKAQVYQAYYRTGAYARRYGTDRLLLLVVVPNETRKSWVREVMLTVKPIVMCFIATWPDIEAHSLDGPAWTRYDTGERCDLWIPPQGGKPEERR